MNSDTDLNLLRALDALLAEGSVAGAARRLGLSPSAMSRTLARLRETTGDPLLVRAGRGMVLTPHAQALQDRVPHIAGEVEAVLGRARGDLNLAALERTFTIRANESFVVAYAAPLLEAVTAVAPGVLLRFAPKPDKDARPLREGFVDLEIGVLGETAPELKVQTLYHDRFVGVARAGHPILTGELTAERYASCGHVLSSRRDRPVDRVGDALAEIGLARRTALLVPTFPTALAIASVSDLVALVPRSFVQAEMERGGMGARSPIRCFELPIVAQHFTVSLIWHPRLDNDPAHRWLRSVIRSHCRPPAETPAR